METEKEADEEEQAPVIGEEDEQENEPAPSANISSFSSSNELNESNESNATSERPEVEETQSKIENEDNAEQHVNAETAERDAAEPTNDLDIESINLNGHEKESDEVDEVKSDKEEATNLNGQAEEDEPKAAVPTVARSWADLFKSGKSTKIMMNVHLDNASTTGNLFSSDAFAPLGSIETFTADDSKLTRQTIEPAPIEEDPTFADFRQKAERSKPETLSTTSDTLWPYKSIELVLH